MPKQELKKDDLEAVLGEGEEIIKTEERAAEEAEFLSGFEEEDDGFKHTESDPAPEGESDKAGEGDTSKDDPPGDTTEPKEGDGADGDKKDDADTDDEETPPWLKTIQEMENRIATRMRNVEGHIGGLKSQLMQAKTDAADAGDDAPTNAQIKDATGKKGSTEKLDKLRTEFPEWADALDELETNMAPAASPAAQAPADVYTRDQVAYIVNSATARARELARVDAAHEGWEEMRDTPEFARWRDSQPEETQTLADSPRAADAIKMFDLYKETITPKAPANTSNKVDRLKRSVAPKTTGAAPVEHIPTEEDDFLAGFRDG